MKENLRIISELCETPNSMDSIPSPNISTIRKRAYEESIITPIETSESSSDTTSVNEKKKWKGLSTYELIDLFTEFVPSKDYRGGFLHKKRDCINAAEAVDILRRELALENGEEAVEIGQEMLDLGILLPYEKGQDKKFYDDKNLFFVYSVNTDWQVLPGGKHLQLGDDEIVERLSNVQCEFIHEVFVLLDKTGEKMIDIESVELFISKLLKLDSQFEKYQLSNWISEFNEEKIDFAKFKVLLGKLLICPFSQEDMKEACEVFNRDGCLNGSDLRSIYRQFGTLEVDYDIENVLEEFEREFPDGLSVHELVDWCENYHT